MIEDIFKLIVAAAIFLYGSSIPTESPVLIEPEPAVIEYFGEEEPAIDEWDLFVHAIAWVESKWDSTAVGKTNDVGWLQITPILVRDVNRILGKDAYSLDDRLSKEKSLEMFDVIQRHYNPSKDMEKACRLWNPGAGISYRNKVMDKFDELNTQEI